VQLLSCSSGPRHENSEAGRRFSHFLSLAACLEGLACASCACVGGGGGGHAISYDENSDVGYTIEVDLHYPTELHHLHNVYPLAPERYKPKGSFCEKLCGTFYDQKDM
jgi:hypothetical protein